MPESMYCIKPVSWLVSGTRLRCWAGKGGPSRPGNPCDRSRRPSNSSTKSNWRQGETDRPQTSIRTDTWAFRSWKVLHVGANRSWSLRAGWDCENRTNARCEETAAHTVPIYANICIEPHTLNLYSLPRNHVIKNVGIIFVQKKSWTINYGSIFFCCTAFYLCWF